MRTPTAYGSTPKDVENVALGVQNRSISETDEDRAKLTINRLHEVVYELSIAAKIYDLQSFNDL